MKKAGVVFSLLCILFTNTLHAQQSVAREWNEELLSAIRVDFARPTVHARNLFHLSIAMYDCWAAYDEVAEPFLLGNNVWGFQCDFDGFPQPSNIEAAREEAISYAAFRLLNHRFDNSPNFDITLPALENRMTSLGYDPTFISTDYSSGNPAAFGNYMAQCLIAFGFQDGANEAQDYSNTVYEPVNESLIPENPGNSTISNPNRWQPLTLEIFIDQSGQVIEGSTPPFLSPEWGQVVPFALSYADKTTYERDGFDYQVYYDPGKPPMLDYEENEAYLPEEYKWGFSIVSAWSSHLDPADGVMWDISPNTNGNITSFPQNFEDYRNFYDFLEGGDPSQGRTINPVTGQPYEVEMVPRGDFTRVLAEFWADGPDSETPPGHWFTLLNYVNDHPMFEKRFKGQGEVLDDLEWDVKAYLLMGGTMHDVAITSWGIKGNYDYIRPISAIRYMADRGQSSDEGLPSYHPHGIPLVDNLIELVEAGDPLAGGSNQNVGKIKLYSWKGPDFINDPETDVAGVGWILAENWWPYQRPTFITPNFAGYVSGHSTYSRAAAEVMTLLTGDEYFPGGIGEFQAPMNEFLVFEEGPSVDVTLQWATYRDASDQTSLSRIWGGIHPPADDIPGRIIGEQIGISSFAKGEEYFEGIVTGIEAPKIQEFVVFPNPVASGSDFTIQMKNSRKIEHVQNILDKEILTTDVMTSVNTTGLKPGVYTLKVAGKNWSKSAQLIIRQ